MHNVQLKCRTNGWKKEREMSSPIKSKGQKAGCSWTKLNLLHTHRVQCKLVDWLAEFNVPGSLADILWKFSMRYISSHEQIGERNLVPTSTCTSTSSISICTSSKQETIVLSIGPALKLNRRNHHDTVRKNEQANEQKEIKYQRQQQSSFAEVLMGE